MIEILIAWTMKQHHFYVASTLSKPYLVNSRKNLYESRHLIQFGNCFSRFKTTFLNGQVEKSTKCQTNQLIPGPSHHINPSGWCTKHWTQHLHAQNKTEMKNK